MILSMARFLINYAKGNLWSSSARKIKLDMRRNQFTYELTNAYSLLI